MRHIIESNRAGAEVEHFASEMTSLLTRKRFIQEVRMAYERIAIMPTIGSIIEELRGSRFSGLRCCTVKRFRNYLIIYSHDDREVRIRHVIHGKLDYLGILQQEAIWDEE